MWTRADTEAFWLTRPPWTPLDALWEAGGWTKIPFRAVLNVDKKLWIEFIKAHCDENAKEAAQMGCFPRGIIVVGRKMATKHIQGYKKLLKTARKDTHKTVLRVRLKCLQWETKHFAPKLP